jgi:protein tyrosine/serine phosphatase
VSALADRRLAWDGCLNVRDLGGFRTDDGRVTEPGRIVRADSIRLLTDAGWEAAVEYGIRTVIDLRFREELADDPPGDLPIDVVHLSLFGERDEERWRELDRRAAAIGDPAGATTMVYLETLEEHRARFGTAVVAVADAQPGGVLVHCVGGKDRTGLVSALLLRLAGVGVDDIAADYALSEHFLAPRHDRWLAEAKDDAERKRIRRISATPARAMARVLTELEHRYGSVHGFLLAAGAGGEALERARARLRD